MFEDFDGMFEFDDGLPGNPVIEPESPPTWRATIRAGKLMLTAWTPWLFTSGPVASLLPSDARTPVTIADLTIHGRDNDEISARFCLRREPYEKAEDILVEWARQVGYKRFWLPDRLLELERDPEALTRASVRCDICRAKWSDATPEFWLIVRASKAFPRWCPACGCELPQWTTEPTDNPKLHPIAKGERWTASDSRRDTRQGKT